MSLTRNEGQRLAFAKYLLSLGKRQMKLHEPNASVSLLLFHDATDHLLGLVSERVGVGKISQQFMDYWGLIHEKQPTYELPNRIAMERFNKARVALKHHGQQHSRAQLEEFQTLVLNFCDKVVADIFNTTLDAVSLAEFIVDERVRRTLKRAGESFEKGNIRKVRYLSALAFDELVKASRFPRSTRPNYDALSIPYVSTNIPHVYHPDGRGSNREAYDFFRSVAESMNALVGAVRLISIGIDFRHYARFYALVPAVGISFRGKRKIFERVPGVTPDLTQEDSEFCIEFVTDAAFQLQDRDFAPPSYRSNREC